MAKIALASPAWNATLRTTCVATLLEGGHAKNALPQLAAANVNCRVQPDERARYVTSTLDRVIGGTAVKLFGDGPPQSGPASPMRQDVLSAVTTETNAL